MSESKQSLLFIPDITGFTDFVNQTEIEHGQHIISELLELIIDSNTLGLKVSEIEGDAVLFYKEGEIPPLKDIIAQAELMFLNFHNHLRRYENQRICHCGACSTANNLSLKIIAHAGKIGFTQVKKQRKPYGAGMILVHKLLKNSVPIDEYLLLTEACLDSLDCNTSDQPAWVKLEAGKDSYDKIGEVNFQYSDLSPLHQFVSTPEPVVSPKKMAKPIEKELIIESPFDKVYDIVTNLEMRLRWNAGVDELVFDKDRVNRVGTRHKCVFHGTGKFLDFETVTDPSLGEDQVVFGERVLNFPFMVEANNYYIMDRIDEHHTKIKFEFHYHPKPFIGWIMAPIMRKKISKQVDGLLQQLKDACEANEDAAPAKSA
ncbi:MAG: DUF2652 domain-containing protein [Bacteroidota bacterium]